MLQEVWSTLASEFSDITDVATATRIAVRILVAGLLGGVLGYDRARKERSAGIRTHMLVAVGTAIFMLGPTQAGMPLGDLSRVIQGVVQGIGFLAAGAIIIGTAARQARGLTTAASVWAAAGIGVAAGIGMEVTAILATATVYFILAVVPLLLRRGSEGRDTPT